MEWIEGQMFTEKNNWPVEFSEPIIVGDDEGEGYRVVVGDNVAGYLVYSEDGEPTPTSDETCERIIHRPPVPAPAQKCEHPIWEREVCPEGTRCKCGKVFPQADPAPQKCEHSWACSWEPGAIWRCSKCKKETLSNPFPSVPAPQPDSVEIAQALKRSVSKLAERYPPEQSEFDSEWRTVLDGIASLADSYISEQTAQRKAAGELAKRSREYAAELVSPEVKTFVLAHAADAETRSGGKNG